MIEKRFRVHSMIKDTEVGETIDLGLCEELIKKYGSLSDIHLLIEDNGNDMTYQEVVDLLNENEQLKQFKEKVFTLINKEIAQNEEAIGWGKETGADSSAMGFYNHMLKRLKKELEE